MKRIFTLMVCAILCVSLLLCGCTNEIATKSDKELNGTVVATVKDDASDTTVEITQADYNFVYKFMYDEMSQYAQYYGEDWLNQAIDEDGTTIENYLKNTAMEQLKQLAAATILAGEKGIEASSKKIKDAVEEAKEQVVKSYGGEDKYIEFLESTRSTDKAVTMYLTRFELYNKLHEALSKEGEAAYVDNDELVKEFSESYMRVQHVLISTQEQTDEDGNTIPARSDEEAQKLVKEVISKLDGGAEFDTLIKEYDEDPGMEEGGFYTFTSGQMVPEFEEASKNLAIGEYTKEGIKTDYGYHIIKRYDIDTSADEFVQYKNQIESQKVMDVVQKKIDALKVTKKDDVINKAIDEWVKELSKETASQIPQAETVPSDENMQIAE